MVGNGKEGLALCGQQKELTSAHELVLNTLLLAASLVLTAIALAPILRGFFGMP